MGQLLDVTCHDCGATSEQIDGPVMMGFNPRCDLCGATKFVALEDLYAGDQPGIDPASEEAWRSRHERIPQLAGSCGCGGSFKEDAPIRCNQCRSPSVATSVTAVAD